MEICIAENMPLTVMIGIWVVAVACIFGGLYFVLDVARALISDTVDGGAAIVFALFFIGLMIIAIGMAMELLL